LKSTGNDEVYIHYKSGGTTMEKFFVVLIIIVVLSGIVMVATDVSIPPSVSGSYISIASSDFFEPDKLKNNDGRYMINFSFLDNMFKIYESGNVVKADRIVSVKRLETGNSNNGEWAYQFKAYPIFGEYNSNRVITVSYVLYKKHFGKKVYVIEYFNPDTGNRFVYICDKVI